MPIDIPVPSEAAGGYGFDTYNALTNAALTQRKQQLENQYYAPNIQSEISQRNALTRGYDIANQYAPERLALANQLSKQTYDYNQQYNPLKLQEERIRAQYADQAEKARIEQMKAMAQWRQSGGMGGGTGQKEELFFQSLVAKENPQLGNDPAKVYEASIVLRNGGDTLSDGTKLNPLSPASRASYDRLTKGTTTAAIITGNKRAEQAEAELEVLNDYAQKGLEPYGNTYGNLSPQQIIDTFRSDEQSQKRLGRFIASQALQYEASQNRIRLANGQPGVAATEEIMKMSGQKVDTKFPMLSYTARKEAARYLDEALSKGLKARQTIGLGASESRGKTNNKNLSDKKWVKMLKPVEGGGYKQFEVDSRDVDEALKSKYRMA